MLQSQIFVLVIGLGPIRDQIKDSQQTTANLKTAVSQRDSYIDGLEEATDALGKRCTDLENKCKFFAKEFKSLCEENKQLRTELNTLKNVNRVNSRYTVLSNHLVKVIMKIDTMLMSHK